MDTLTAVAASPPARAAWIETPSAAASTVAIAESPPAWAAWIETRKHPVIPPFGRTSPPARAAWIETQESRSPRISGTIVAALAGGVD